MRKEEGSSGGGLGATGTGVGTAGGRAIRLKGGGMSGKNLCQQFSNIGSAVSHVTINLEREKLKF